MHQFGFQLGPAPYPLANQLTPELVSQSITVADTQDARSRYSTQRFGLVAGIIGSLLLCLLFSLAFGKVEYLDKIIALFVGFVGGYGYAKSASK